MKGVSIMPDSIIFLVLGLVTAIIAILFVASIGSTPIIDEAPCTALSMLSQLQNRLGGVSVIQASGSRFERSDLCPPMEVVVSARASDEKALETIADQMAMCHRNYGEGNLDLFEQERRSKNLYCVLCAHVSFEGSGDLEGLTDFLITERIPGRKQTYAEYIGGIDDPSAITADLPPVTIDRDTDYGVLYYYWKKTEFTHNPAEAALAGGVAGAIMVGAGVGAVLGPPGSIAGALISGTLVIASAAASFYVGAAIGGALIPSGAEYVGATVFVPWDQEVFENSLKCDQMVSV